MAQKLTKYIKGRGRFKNRNVGMLLGDISNGDIIITSCKANVVAGDVFDKKLARKIVEDRMDSLKEHGSVSVIPQSFKGEVDHFEDRCIRYFKVNSFREIQFKKERHG